MELRLRPPGVDLWGGAPASAPEASLLFLLLGAGERRWASSVCWVVGEGLHSAAGASQWWVQQAGRHARRATDTGCPLASSGLPAPHFPLAVYLHRLPHLLGAAGVALECLDSRPLFVGLAAATLAAPGLLLFAAHSLVEATGGRGGAAGAAALAGALGWKGHGREDRGQGGSVGAGSTTGGSGGSLGLGAAFLHLSLAYTPLVWAATLAYYSDFLLSEGGRVLEASACTRLPCLVVGGVGAGQRHAATHP